MSSAAAAPLIPNDSLSLRYRIQLGERFRLDKVETKQNSVCISLFPLAESYKKNENAAYQALKKQYKITKMDGSKDSKFILLCEDAIVALNPSLKGVNLQKKQISVLITHGPSTFSFPSSVVVSLYKLRRRGCCCFCS